MSAVVKLRRIPSGLFRLYDEAQRSARNLPEIGVALHPPITETPDTLIAYLEAFARLAPARILVPSLVAEIEQLLAAGNFDEESHNGVRHPG